MRQKQDPVFLLCLMFEIIKQVSVTGVTKNSINNCSVEFADRFKGFQNASNPTRSRFSLGRHLPASGIPVLVCSVEFADRFQGLQNASNDIFKRVSRLKNSFFMGEHEDFLEENNKIYQIRPMSPFNTINLNFYNWG
jgi:hypothetical protein